MQGRVLQKEIIFVSAPKVAFKSKVKLWNMSFRGTILKQAIVFLCNYFSYW